MKESGIGTPATRAAIIERLIQVGYIERDGRALVVTEKGLNVIRLLGEHALTSPGLTGDWERRLAKIETGEDSREAFMGDIVKFTESTVGELDTKLKDVRIPRANLGPCPVCGHDIIENRKGYSCWSREDPGCGFVIWKSKAGKTLPVAVARELIKTGRTEKPVTGFKGRSGKSFRARLALQQTEEGKWRVEFDEPWAKEGAKPPEAEDAEAAEATRRDHGAARSGSKRGRRSGADAGLRLLGEAPRVRAGARRERRWPGSWSARARRATVSARNGDREPGVAPVPDPPRRKRDLIADVLAPAADIRGAEPVRRAARCPGTPGGPDDRRLAAVIEPVSSQAGPHQVVGRASGQAVVERHESRPHERAGEVVGRGGEQLRRMRPRAVSGLGRPAPRSRWPTAARLSAAHAAAVSREQPASSSRRGRAPPWGDAADARPRSRQLRQGRRGAGRVRRRRAPRRDAGRADRGGRRPLRARAGRATAPCSARC